MKNLQLTELEMKTLLWAVQKVYAQETLKALERGEKPSDDKTIQRLNEIARKAYISLT